MSNHNMSLERNKKKVSLNDHQISSLLGLLFVLEHI